VTEQISPPRLAVRFIEKRIETTRLGIQGLGVNEGQTHDGDCRVRMTQLPASV